MMPFDFLALLLGFAAVVTTIVLCCCALKKRRLRHLTSPRKDYYRPHEGTHHRTHRIDKIDG